MERLRRLLKVLWIGLTMIGGMLVIAWKVIRDKREEAAAVDAARASGEARKDRVRKAGEAGDIETIDREWK
jgi:hypothetical protein